MKIVKLVLLILILGFAGIQFIPVNLNQNKIITSKDFIEIYKSSETIADLLKISCYDCHSNNTNYPWYSKIQPTGLMLEHHIKEGKEELNFSEFDSYSDRRKKSKLKSIISQIRDNEMPLKSYTFMHKKTKLTDQEKTILIEWIERIRDSI